MKLYKVGGCVRDALLGVKSNDIDYVMVLDYTDITIEEGYMIMKQYMLDNGFTIFLETPEMVTIRGKFPKGHKNEGITGDFVLARKEVGYVEGTRRPILEIGTLFDDLVRRDFTLNALAEDEDGNIIDFFNGREDLESRFLITPLDPKVTFLDDPLRLLRGIRFNITKGFRLDKKIYDTMSNPEILNKLKQVVSQERVRDELFKMFKHDTLRTIEFLTYLDKNHCSGLLDICFGGEMWLKPTFEAR